MIRIERSYTPFGTLGRLSGLGLNLSTIELPWRSNRVGESCIPQGAYRAICHDSPQHGDSLWLRGVTGRTEILIHVANGPHQLDGCIAPGLEPGIWCEHDELSVWNSADAMSQLFAAVSKVGGEVTIDIRTWSPEWP